MMIEPDNGFEAPERECEYLFHTVLRILVQMTKLLWLVHK